MNKLELAEYPAHIRIVPLILISFIVFICYIIQFLYFCGSNVFFSAHAIHSFDNWALDSIIIHGTLRFCGICQGGKSEATERASGWGWYPSVTLATWVRGSKSLAWKKPVSLPGRAVTTAKRQAKITCSRTVMKINNGKYPLLKSPIKHLFILNSYRQFVSPLLMNYSMNFASLDLSK